jgi:two-component system LytT family response regulator
MQDTMPLQGNIMDVVIVDDESAARRALRECCAREADLRVVGEFSNSRTALKAIQARPPALLFLDVQIDSLTGIEVARALDPDTLPQIVFVSAYDHYALEAFEVSAIDYLLKPFDEDRFQATLARVRRRREVGSLAERQATLSAVLDQMERSARATAYEARPRVIANAGGQTHVLDVAQVELIEADRNYIRLTVGRKTYSARSTLQQAEASLQSQPMLKISRSCLVNMSHIAEIDSTLRGDTILVLAGGTTVITSKGFRSAVKEQLERMKIHPRKAK